MANIINKELEHRLGGEIIVRLLYRCEVVGCVSYSMKEYIVVCTENKSCLIDKLMAINHIHSINCARHVDVTFPNL